MVSVEAPSRMSIRGQSTLACCVLATGCGFRCDAPEKNVAILSLREGGLDGGGGGTGVADVAVAGVAAAVVVGAALDVDAVDGVPTPRVLLVQPGANSASQSTAAISARSSPFIRYKSHPQSIAIVAMPSIL